MQTISRLKYRKIAITWFQQVKKRKLIFTISRHPWQCCLILQFRIVQGKPPTAATMEHSLICLTKENEIQNLLVTLHKGGYWMNLVGTRGRKIKLIYVHCLTFVIFQNQNRCIQKTDNSFSSTVPLLKIISLTMHCDHPLKGVQLRHRVLSHLAIICFYSIAILPKTLDFIKGVSGEVEFPRPCLNTRYRSNLCTSS